MSTTGPNNPSAASSTDRGASYPAWSNPTRVYGSNNSRAAAALDATAGTAVSDFLDVTGFSFAIPNGETIVGVVVEVERNGDPASGIKDETVQLIKGGTAQGDNKADTGVYWPFADAYKSYGGAADLWGLTLAEADVEAANFGVRIAAESVATEAAVASVDHVRITVYSSAAGGGQPTRTMQQVRLRRA